QTALFFLLTLFAFQSIAQNFNVSESEALQTAKTIEESVKNNNPDVLSNFFDLPLLDNLIEQQSIMAKKSGAMFDGFKSTFNMNYFGKEMANNLQTGSYELVRTYQDKNK